MNRYVLSKAGIDVNEGLHRFGGNKEMYEDYLKRFPEDEHYQAMLDAIHGCDVKAAFFHAHALKGVTGTLSLKKMYNDLFPLVEVLRADSLEGVEELLKPVMEDYNLLVRTVQG